VCAFCLHAAMDDRPPSWPRPPCTPSRPSGSPLLHCPSGSHSSSALRALAKAAPTATLGEIALGESALGDVMLDRGASSIISPAQGHAGHGSCIIVLVFHEYYVNIKSCLHPASYKYQLPGSCADKLQIANTSFLVLQLASCWPAVDPVERESADE
jgi:hypothetical protein